MNDRTRERVLLAASAVECHNARESAVLGGIVRCLLYTGQMDFNFARHAASALIEWGGTTLRSGSPVGVHPTEGPIAAIDHGRLLSEFPMTADATEAEVRLMAQRFLGSYDPGRPA